MISGKRGTSEKIGGTNKSSKKHYIQKSGTSEKSGVPRSSRKNLTIKKNGTLEKFGSTRKSCKNMTSRKSGISTKIGHTYESAHLESCTCLHLVPYKCERSNMKIANRKQQTANNQEQNHIANSKQQIAKASCK